MSSSSPSPTPQMGQILAQRAQEILAVACYGYILLDAQNRICDLNDPACALLATSAEDSIIGQDLEQFLRISDEQGSQLSYAQALEQQFPLRLSDAQGQVAWVALHEYPLPQQDERLLVLCDISPLQRQHSARQYQARLDGLGHLAAGIAHEFNNLLCSIVGHAALIEREPEKQTALRAAAISQAGNKSALLLRKLQALGRRSPRHSSCLILEDLLRTVVRTVSDEITSPLILEGAATASQLQLLGDQEALCEALCSLISHIEDTMSEASEISLTSELLQLGSIEAQQLSPPLAAGSWICLSLFDAKDAIDLHQLRLLFDPFMTAIADSGPVGSGMDLRLATALNTIAQHGGGIQVCRDRSCGPTLRMYLPQHQGASPVAGSDPSAPPPPPVSLDGSGLKVLIVEDEASIRGILEGFLSDSKWGVQSAATLSQARSCLKNPAPDVVLLDLGLPDGSGEELIAPLRRAWPETAIVVMSGYYDDALYQQLRTQGIHAIIEKPFALAQIAKALHSACQDQDPGPAAPPSP